MRCARPSTMAVLPTPGSPISTGLFLVRRRETCMTRRISSSRPMTGSSLPCGRSSVRSHAVLLKRLVLVFGVLVRHVSAAADVLDGFAQGSSLVYSGSAESCRRARLVGDREQEVLGGDVLVLQLARFAECLVQDFVDSAGHSASVAARRRSLWRPYRARLRLASSGRQRKLRACRGWERSCRPPARAWRGRGVRRRCWSADSGSQPAEPLERRPGL